MSRSNPNQDGTPNPSTRWFEWDGAAGGVRYYNKEKKENVAVPLPFKFLAIDRMATIKGWHDPSESGIVSNEIRDTTRESFLVRSFKGGKLAEGFYRDIKDTIVAVGGHYTAVIYLVYRIDDEEGTQYRIGALQLKGAGLGGWMDFEKENKSEIYTKAISLVGAEAGTKGKVKFQIPKFALVEASAEANEAAIELDKKLQVYLKEYLSKNTKEQLPAVKPEADDGFVPPPDKPDHIQPGEEDVEF